jgi:hemerythrin
MSGNNEHEISTERRRGSINHKDLETFRVEVFDHVDKRTEEIKSLIQSGFPEGNLEKHKDVHEKFIAAAQDRQNMWRSLRDHILKGIAWSGIGIVCLAVWEYIKIEVRK